MEHAWKFYTVGYTSGLIIPATLQTLCKFHTSYMENLLKYLQTEMVAYINGPIMLTSLFEFHAISMIFMFKRLCMEHAWNLRRKSHRSNFLYYFMLSFFRLSGFHLCGFHLCGIYLGFIHLCGIHLGFIHLCGIHLCGFHLCGIHLLGFILWDSSLLPLFMPS